MYRYMARVPADHTIFRELQDLMAEANIDARIDNAIKHPETADAKELHQKLLRMLSFTTKCMPYSPAKRKFCILQLYSMVAFAGLPSVFHTINPADMDLLSTVKLSRGSQGTDGINCDDYLVRAKIVKSNPAYASDTFHRFIVSILENIFGANVESRSVRITEPPTREKNVGVFGLCRGQFSVDESQGRGSLHLHGLLWAIFDAYKVHEALKSTDEAKVNAMRELLDATFHTREMPAPAANYVEEARPSYGPPPEVHAANNAYQTHLKSCVDKMQVHAKCHETCGPGKCRFGLPAMQIPETGLYRVELDDDGEFQGVLVPYEPGMTPSQQPNHRAFKYANDDEGDGTEECPLVLLTKRPGEQDDIIVPFNPTLTALAGCNTCIVLMGTKSQAEAVMYYVTKYITKNSMPLEACLVPFAEAAKLSKQKSSTAADAGTTERDTKFVLQLFANKHIGTTEISSQMAFNAILGNPAEYTSVQFETVYPWAAVSYLTGGPDRYQVDDLGEETNNEIEAENDDNNNDNNNDNGNTS
jgi:hypothetical protein